MIRVVSLVVELPDDRLFDFEPFDAPTEASRLAGRDDFADPGSFNLDLGFDLLLDFDFDAPGTVAGESGLELDPLLIVL